MKNLTTAIFSHAAGSAFMTSIGGRLYKARVPQATAWPYALFFVVSDVPMDTFKDKIEDVVVQFSVFSKASSSSEIEDIFTNLKAKYDNALLTITDNTMVVMDRQQASLTNVAEDTPDGTGEYWQYDVDYNIVMQKN
jgi:hypothetical protein